MSLPCDGHEFVLASLSVIIDFTETTGHDHAHSDTCIGAVLHRLLHRACRNHDEREFDGGSQLMGGFLYSGESGQPHNRAALRIHRKDAAFVAVLNQVLDGQPPHRTESLSSTDDRNRTCRPQC